MLPIDVHRGVPTQLVRSFVRTKRVLLYESTSMTHFNDVRWMVERNVARSLDNDNDGGGGPGARNGWWWWEGICAVCDVANGIRLAVDRMSDDDDPQKMNATQQSTKNNVEEIFDEGADWGGRAVQWFWGGSKAGRKLCNKNQIYEFYF